MASEGEPELPSSTRSIIVGAGRLRETPAPYWKPIQDLPATWPDLKIPDLHSLATVWQEQAGKLKESLAYREFSARLRREVAIETGILERLYSIDRGITRLLIEEGLHEALIPHGATDKPSAEVIAIIRDQEDAIEGLFDFVGQQRQLSTSYIKSLHQALTRHQESTEALVPATGQIVGVPLLKGEWKQLPNNPVSPGGRVLIEYCPPEQVQSEMDNLVAWHGQHVKEGVAPEVEAAWLHHRFTQVHPFQDGNGRVARCLASLVLIRAEWFPLAIDRDDRTMYLDALEAADRGEPAPLVTLFGRAQKRAFIRALGLPEQVLHERAAVKTVLMAAADTLKRRQEARAKEIRARAGEHAQLLFELGEQRFGALAAEVKEALAPVAPKAKIYAAEARAGSAEAHCNRFQIIATARQYDYYANLAEYSSWIRLTIRLEDHTEILMSFHGVGYEFVGLLIATACAYRKDKEVIRDLQRLTDEPFQFSYADEADDLKERFGRWLEGAIVAGLDYWRRGL